MKNLRYGLAVVAAAAMLSLTACAPPASTPLPQSGAGPQPSGAPSPSAAVDPTAMPSASPTPTEPPAPSTAVIPASGVQTNGLPQYPVLEQQALVYTGVIAESPSVVPKEERTTTPIEKVEAAGGAAPTQDYVLNLTYKLCMTTQMYQGQGMPLNDAMTKAMSEVPGWVGFASSDNAGLATAYMDVAMTSYGYVCVPLMDERARADLERGVYQG